MTFRYVLMIGGLIVTIVAAMGTAFPTMHSVHAQNDLTECPPGGGWALSVWTGANGTAVSDAVASCDEVEIEVAWSFDVDDQGWKGWDADAPPALNEFQTVDNLQALFIRAKAEPFNGTLGPVVVVGSSAPPVVLLEDVRMARHSGFDRIVFEFQGSQLPGYRVEYVQPPILADGSGLPVDIEGEAFLRVQFTPASGVDRDSGELVYTGPTEFMPGFPTLVELESTGDFEAVLTWVAGLSEQMLFRVIELEGPTRLVVDIAHP